MTFVFKIKYESTLRRLLVEKGSHGGPDLTFMGLESRIHHMFLIKLNEKFVITYSDQDNDTVIMGTDHDLYDACVVQKLNPLRLFVKMDSRHEMEKVEVPDGSSDKPMDDIDERSKPPISKDLVLDNMLEKLKQLPGGCFSTLKAVLPPEAISELVRGLLKPATGEAISMPIAALPSKAECIIGVNDFKQHPNVRNYTSDTLAAAEHIIHRGVQCDACGMFPISGLRFNSIKKENYDLCSACFLKLGNETDYRRLEKPIYSRSLHHHRRLHRRHHHHWQTGHPLGAPFQPLQPCFERREFNGEKTHDLATKLGARFVQDVTILDGTQVAAGTSFTKVWRLRNSGTLPWPYLTELVHIGGDILGSDKPSVLKLPEEGLACDREVDASVDLVAPQRPGRYVSHWRLMAPSGQKFGQRVWVLIQVGPRDEGGMPNEKPCESIEASMQEPSDDISE